MKTLKILFHRVTFIAVVLLFEIALLLLFVYAFRDYYATIMLIARICGVFIILYIISRSKHLSFDLLWVLGIIVMPLAITILYFLVETNFIKSRTFRSIVSSTEESEKYYGDNPVILNEMSYVAPAYKGQFRYISEDAGFPFYKSRDFRYYKLGDDGYPQMLEDLEKAEHFIFLEYFIVQEGKMWNGILDILEKKASDGLEVRVLYDDLGSFTTLSPNYARQLQEKGIKCIAFNRINPMLGAIMNHRDHRKIMVIDGITAYSGGINLADEYINAIVKYGHWKDNIMRVTGECVDSFTTMFLSHWYALSTDPHDYESFLGRFSEDINFSQKETDAGKPQDGYVALYGETPFDDELTSQSIYMNILNQATDYCYIFTPYLIIDTEMINCLILAAKRGVDVRILTPGIPDKKVVWKITRSYYQVLIRGGVKIYEYTPGFVHSKVFVSDDRVATVGTVNLDYRSLYLHFENGTYIFDSSAVKDVRDDYVESEKVSHEVKIEECSKLLISRLALAFLRLFAPLL